MTRHSWFSASVTILFGVLGISSQVLGGIVINEIHYDPPVKTELAEFIELYNTDLTPVDISGWTLSDAVEFEFPAGTSIPAGGFLVAAQNPIAFNRKFGQTAVGPWQGRLSSSGEKIVLRNSSGQIVDEVEYKLGFPWPTVGDLPGYSIELANPGSDNNLGGSWRSSVKGAAQQASLTLIPERSEWKYLKGTQEASNPTSNWRSRTFSDSGWSVGAAPIGYGENFLATTLSDMRNNYASVYLRKTFQVSNPASITGLQLAGLLDDGFNVWINGTHILGFNMPGVNVSYNATANSALENLEYQVFDLPNPSSYLIAGENSIAIQAHNSDIGNSTDFFIDARLVAVTGSANRGPTPGARNAAFEENIAPQIRQVDHLPVQPVSGEPVIITAKVTDPDGVSSVSLQYQLVDPGKYIELADVAYQTNWITVSMNDAGTGGDERASDSIYSAQLPPDIQVHRRLVRYRITAADAGNRNITAPYPDDPQPNFAYFVYDGVPSWSGAIQPGSADVNRRRVTTYDTNIMRKLPVYHLISKNASVRASTWTEQYRGDAYKWKGTLVYDGEVYDHISFRARGGVWRYAMGKNMWKFDFNRGHDFQPRDNFGRQYDVGWTKLNLGACIQQGDYLHRGEQGMFESVGFRLFNLAGVDSPLTHFVQFRVIDDAAEAQPSNQYEGDLWGLYLAIEQEDGRFLDQHDLPDGNLYKMEGGTGELNNQGPTAASDKSDLNQFIATYRNTNPSDSWWRTNLNLHSYYGYRTIVEAIHHYDIDEGAGKNYFYYLNPETGLWSVHAWDLDLTWADNMYGGGEEPFKRRVLASSRTAFNIDYDNRIRDIRDLLFNTDQAFQLIDEHAAMIDDPNGGPSFVDVDRAMWDYNPIMTSGFVIASKAGTGRFYQAANTKDFPGMVQKMKNYVQTRSTFLDNLAQDNAIPSKPVISYVGAPGFQANRLAFRANSYNGANAFAAMKWRIGEVTPTNAPPFDPNRPRKYEIEPVWESGEITTFSSEVSIPAGAVEVGHRYRARVRMKDVTGRWSHWSDPVEFTAAEPDSASTLANHLRITELMYNPAGGNDYEFVELHNTSSTASLDLGGATFSQGIEYTFAPGTTLAPGEYLVLSKGSSANNFAAFRSHYGLDSSVRIVGPYSGSLNNAGEQVRLETTADGQNILDFEYAESRGWPVSANGAGHSLVPLASTLSSSDAGILNYPGNWRSSSFLKGSPGKEDPRAHPMAIALNEVMAHTTYSDPAKPEYDSNDWIELYNATSDAITLNGWFLSDDPANLKKWAIPANTRLNGRAWLAFDEVTGFHSPTSSGFGLDKAGEALFLSYLPGTAEDRVVDSIRFKGQDSNTSLARVPDGGDYWVAAQPTRGTANTAAAPSVVISEVMYHPSPTTTHSADNTADEFIELYNPTAGPVALFGTNGVWRLDGGVQFLFPANTTLAPGGTLLVVSFSPSDAVALNAFKFRYGNIPQTVQIVGPYTGKLNNSSDRIGIERPQSPDVPGEAFSWIVVDEIIYSDQAPWATAADGDGASLHRISATQSGMASQNWKAEQPNPGAYSSGPVGTRDSDQDGIPDEWESSNGLDPKNPSDGSLDSDQDGRTNLQEYQSGTDPRNPQSALRLEKVEFDNASPKLTFTAAAGRAYTVEYCDSLTGGAWINLQDLNAHTASRKVEIVDPFPAIGNRYYRIVVRIP